jgi:hypothetical protein
MAAVNAFAKLRLNAAKKARDAAKAQKLAASKLLQGGKPAKQLPDKEKV